MQTYSYFSRNLLVEQLQKVLLTKRIKPINWNYYLYFALPGQNRLFILVNSTNYYLEAYIKYEDRNRKDIKIVSKHIKNLVHIDSLSRFIDKKIEWLNLNNNIIVNNKDLFWTESYKDEDFDILEKNNEKLVSKT